MFQLNERRTCCDYGAGTEDNWCSRFEMSDALMWANRTDCAVPDLGQLGCFLFFFFESGRTQRGPAHSELVIVVPGPADRDRTRSS